MKYFTPDLLNRCRSSDDDIADAAAKKWDRATAAYTARLQKIRASLPLGARQLLRHVSLHDAQCLTITTAEDRKEFFLTFRLAYSATHPAGGVELRYTLAGAPTVLLDKSHLPAEEPFSRFVLYDEFDLHERKGVAVFTHFLLMTGGLELRLQFSNLRLRWFESVLLPNSNAADIEKEWAGNAQLAIT